MIDFVQVEQSVRDLKKEFAEGYLDEKALEEQLLQLIEVAEDGHYWMFGHRTERWFRYNGKKWVLDHPSSISPDYAHLGISNQPPSTLTEYAVDWNEVVFSLFLIMAVGIIVYSKTASLL